MTNQPPVSIWGQVNDTVVSRLYGHFSGYLSSPGMQLLLIVGVAIFAHVMVKIIRHISEWFIYKSHAQRNPLGFVTQQPKFITVTRLIVSGVIFAIYFLAIGLVLRKLFGVKLETYLASASIIGLAISFGSQGLVQDIVSGLTLIFCGAMDVGDLVEITGAATVTGRVEEIGLRYTKLVNFYRQTVYIPNRTIANVSRFPYGGVDAYGDVHVPPGADREKAVRAVEDIARGMREQFGALILSEPAIDRVEAGQGGGDFLRAHFKIWPGQGNLIETTFRQRVVGAMKVFDANYADWQVPVTYRAITPPRNPEPPSESDSAGNKD